MRIKKTRLEKLSKFTAMWVWEPKINNHLKDYGLQYKSIICIQTAIPLYEYNVYISVDEIYDYMNPIKIVKISVKFDEGLKTIESEMDLLKKENLNNSYTNIKNIPSDELILDYRSKHFLGKDKDF